MKAFALIAALVFATSATAQQSPAEAALAAQAQIEQATVALDAAQSGRDRVNALTGVVHAFEAGLAAVRDGLRQAAIRTQFLESQLETKEEEVARLLGVLQVLSRTESPALLLHPNGPTGTAQSGMILADITPIVQAEVSLLRDDLTELNTLRALQQGAAANLQEGLNGAQQARVALAMAISERAPLPKRFVEDPIQTALLIAGSETLEVFASGLVELSIDEDRSVLPRPELVKGNMPWPVFGSLLRGYNEADAAGIFRPGLILATRAQSLVVSPAAATVRYRGPLLDYGNVIMLEPARNTLLVLAGLADVYVATGDVVQQGAPLGLMGRAATGNGVERTQTLYIEVREIGSPVDPTTWFAQN